MTFFYDNSLLAIDEKILSEKKLHTMSDIK